MNFWIIVKKRFMPLCNTTCTIKSLKNFLMEKCMQVDKSFKCDGAQSMAKNELLIQLK